jgi:hypothetical protein
MSRINRPAPAACAVLGWRPGRNGKDVAVPAIVKFHLAHGAIFNVKEEFLMLISCSSLCVMVFTWQSAALEALAIESVNRRCLQPER